tara:strand:+ start:267 stop:410 length:144 start_codon:yes stop_codon:yes gene_type:complete
MSKEDIFEQLKVIRDMLPECTIGDQGQFVYDEIQSLIWKVGEDIGEF